MITGLWNLIVGSLGLLVAVGFAGVMLWHWRRQPVHSYRLVVVVLIATLVLPVGQFLAQNTGLSRLMPVDNPLARWTSALTSDSPDASIGGTGGIGGNTELGTPDWIEGDAMSSVYLTVLVKPATAMGLDTLASAAPVSLTDAGPLVLRASANNPLGFGVGAESTPPIGTIAPNFLSRDQLALVFGVLAGLYLVGVVLSLVRTAIRVRRANQLLRNATPVHDREVLAVWNKLLRTSPLRSRVQLRKSSEVASPMCFGLSTPVVLLPASSEPKLAPEVLSCVLLHELVHLERGDTWTMLGQEVLRSFFWFHPAAWWLCKRIDMLREISCDLLVVRRTGRRKRYASALVEYAAWMRHGDGIPQTVPSTALLPWTTTNSQLARRIEMLVSTSSVRRPSRRSTIVVAGAAFSALWGGQLALAASSPMQDSHDHHAHKEHVHQHEEHQHNEVAPNIDLGDLRVEMDGLIEGVDLQEILAAVGDLDLHELDLENLVAGENLEQTLGLLKSSSGLVEFFPSASGDHGGSSYQIIQSGDDSDSPRIGVYVSIGDSPEQHIVINKVVDGSLADGAGIQAEDIIIRINGEDATWDELQAAKRKLKAGNMKLEIIRNGENVEVVVDGKSKGDKCKQCESSKSNVRTWSWSNDDSSDSSDSKGFFEFRGGSDGEEGGIFEFVSPETIILDGSEDHSFFSTGSEDGKNAMILKLKSKLAKAKDLAGKAKIKFAQRGGIHAEAKEQYKHVLDLTRSLQDEEGNIHFPGMMELKFDGSDFPGIMELKLDGADFEKLHEHLNKLPDAARGHVYKALKGLHTESGNNEGDAMGIFKRLHTKGSNRPHGEHGQSDVHKKHGEWNVFGAGPEDADRSLKGEIEELRARMKEREQELNMLRKKLEKLRTIKKEDHSKPSGNTHFEWRRSEDQATLYPVPVQSFTQTVTVGEPTAN